MALTSLSALDGRYESRVSELAPILSEYGLIRARVKVEVEYVKALAREKEVTGLKPLSKKNEDFLSGLVHDFSVKDAEEIKKIESTTKHDVKAVEYWLQKKCTKAGFGHINSFIHFGLTSEDVNSTAYALMLKEAMKGIVVPEVVKLQKTYAQMARKYAKLPLLARTHGQPATPTTLGKECAVVAERLARKIAQLTAMPYYAKLSGATGTYAALHCAYPRVQWPRFAGRLLKKLGLSQHGATTQIEPHDYVAEILSCISHINAIGIDAAADAWLMISRDLLTLKKVEGEVGSSTMPHKINPIDFENAEGNFGISSAVCMHLAGVLPVSRLQRDLVDSTRMRNLAVGVGHHVLAVKSMLAGLQKITPNKKAMQREIDGHPEVLAEAIQTVLRAEGDASAYDTLKKATRGVKITMDDLKNIIDGLPISAERKSALKKLTPSTYVGLAENIAKGAKGV